MNPEYIYLPRQVLNNSTLFVNYDFFAKNDMILPWPLGTGFFVLAVPVLALDEGAGFCGRGVSSSEYDSQAVSRTVTKFRHKPD
jgi:hypothetical protein